MSTYNQTLANNMNQLTAPSPGQHGDLPKFNPLPPGGVGGHMVSRGSESA